MLRAYRYRLYPSDEQKETLSRHFGNCRFIWNYFLDLRNRMYEESGKGMSYKEMSAQLKLLKRKEGYEWLGEVNSQSLQQSLMHLDTAFQRFFKHLGNYPTFKRKSNHQSFVVPQRFKVKGNRIHIPNVNGGIRMFRHREFNGTVRNITISHNPSGEYYASILVLEKDEAVNEMPISFQSTVGLDVGLIGFATLSNGLQIGAPKYLTKSEKKLRRAQKRLSRRTKGSNNRRKQRIKVARMHQHISEQRKDFQNKVTDVLTRTYDTVAVESLNTQGMMKNHHLAGSISDAGWSSFISMLKTKASQRGKSVVEIGRFEPSSKMCSRCGSVKHLKLSERIYRCDDCGLVMDRDLNASVNVKKFALIRMAVPTDSGELTPVDRSANTLSLLEREGIGQVRWLNQEAPAL